MSYCVSHEQCPECAKHGNDRSSNNLAVYDDGSSYCFSCGYFTTASGLHSLRAREQQHETRIGLPIDISTELPQIARNFLKQYALTDLDIKQNHIMWSDYWSRLIFPYFDNKGLVAWQGRYLGSEKKAKWFSQGNLTEYIHIVGNNKSDTVVLTEDIISAIVVGHDRTVAACPIFGSHVSTKRLLRLKHFYGTMKLWLDYDKAEYAMKVSHTANLLGIKSTCIITEKDPKEYNDTEIKQWLYS